MKMFDRKILKLFYVAWIVYCMGAVVFLLGVTILVWKYALAAWAVGK